jgi:hypothetical protein
VTKQVAASRKEYLRRQFESTTRDLLQASAVAYAPPEIITDDDNLDNLSGIEFVFRQPQQFDNDRLAITAAYLQLPGTPFECADVDAESSEVSKQFTMMLATGGEVVPHVVSWSLKCPEVLNAGPRVIWTSPNLTKLIPLACDGMHCALHAWAGSDGIRFIAAALGAFSPIRLTIEFAHEP